MKKVISYSLFGSRRETKETIHEWRFYLRGLYWNTRMNALIYPDWTTHVEVDSATFSEYDNIFYELNKHYGLTFNINFEGTLAGSMLWRMKLIFNDEVEYVITRDLDAVTTYREAQAVQSFLNSGLDVHCITDNKVHGIGIMGGMGGYKCAALKHRYGTYENMVRQSSIHVSERGSDQLFLNSIVYADFKEKVFSHYLQNQLGNGEAITKHSIDDIILDGVDRKLWESNLVAAFIGSPGINEMEAYRFFKRFDKETEFEETAKRYPNIFTWYL